MISNTTPQIRIPIHKLHAVISPKEIESTFSSLKSMLLSVQDQTGHSFDPLLESLEEIEIDEDQSPASQAKILQVDPKEIVQNVPHLFWRHIAGTNARSELLTAVGAGWTGNIQQASDELFLPQTSVQRASHRLADARTLSVDTVKNARIISKGEHYSVPFEADKHNYISWIGWIRALLRIKPLIQKNREKDLDDRLEQRFTETVYSILNEELLHPEFIHRHGKEVPKSLLNRVKETKDQS